MKRLALNEDDRILTAYAERATGPGWANRPVWLIVAGADGKIRQECFQPYEQTVDMGTLYDISEAAHKAMTSAAKLAVRRVKRAA